MKFQLKALVAAIAIVAAVPAQAAIQIAGSNGASSLILTLVDNTNVVTATFDLGFDYNTFDRSANQTFDIASNPDYSAAWTAFNAAASAGKQWGIYANNRTGTGAGQQNRLVTIGVASTSTPATTNSSLTTTASNFEGFLTANNNLAANGSSLLSNHNSVANGSSFVSGVAATATVSGTSAGAYGQQAAAGKINGVGGDTTGAFDTDLFVQTISRTSGINVLSSQLVVAGFNPFFNLSSSGVLTYTASNAAPIPEPETYGMLLAGLGMIGFVARRRKSA